jgi:heme/copper-type cytochrome/quinol oxidase subunit 3
MGMAYHQLISTSGFPIVFVQISTIDFGVTVLKYSLNICHYVNIFYILTGIHKTGRKIIAAL